MKAKVTPGTIWHVPDDMWKWISHVFGPEKQPGTAGRPAVPNRTVLNGILYVLRTGCQWKAVPREFSSGSTVHRRFQQWAQAHVFEMIWVVLLEHYDAECGIGWLWQALDSATIKARRGGSKTGPNPTDRAKSGSKRHVLTDARGAPLAEEITGANTHDMKAALHTLDSVVVERPKPTATNQQHLSLDKGYDYPEIDRGVAERGYTGHTRRRGEVIPTSGLKHPARRWINERTHAWHNGFRKVAVRNEKKDDNYLALVDFASAFIVYRIAARCLGP